MRAETFGRLLRWVACLGVVTAFGQLATGQSIDGTMESWEVSQADRALGGSINWLAATLLGLGLLVPLLIPLIRRTWVVQTWKRCVYPLPVLVLLAEILPAALAFKWKQVLSWLELNPAYFDNLAIPFDAQGLWFGIASGQALALSWGKVGLFLAAAPVAGTLAAAAVYRWILPRSRSVEKNVRTAQTAERRLVEAS